MTDARSTLPGTDRPRSPDPRSGPVDPDERATVTVYLRRGAETPGDTVRLTRGEWSMRMAPMSTDVAALSSFAADHALEVGAVDPARAAVALTGRLGDLAAAFGTDLAVHTPPGGAAYRGRSGPLTVPTGVAAVIGAVLGLDTRPQARSQIRLGSATAVSYSPDEVAAAYDYPSTASGQTVALIELGGGFRPADIETYFAGLALPVPEVTAVAVDDGANTPGTADGPDAEVMLDIEVVGAAAPGAGVVVYFAPNTDQGFIDAVTTAVHDTVNHPSVVSISWGGAESTWTDQAMQQMEAAFSAAGTLGVTVVVAAGDNGSGDGQTDGEAHVDFPASAPHALACGGTTLILTGAAPGATPAIASEVVWDDLASDGGATGGGVSAFFPLPTWQQGADVPPSADEGGIAGRGVPDVAGDADPETGYAIRVDGSATVVGGTSAVAPLWAALVARLNAGLGRDLGFLNPQLYALAGGAPATGPVTGDITSGTNGSYLAGVGWDACTGLGSPRGAALLAALQASATPPVTPPVTDPSSPQEP